MKKFLTVLLALSVVFTYTVGTAFAAAPTTPSTSADQSEQAFKTVVQDVKDSLSYDGYGYLHTSGIAGNYLSKAAIEERIDELAKVYITNIRNASNAWDNQWSSVTTVNDFITETGLFSADFTIAGVATTSGNESASKSYAPAANTPTDVRTFNGGATYADPANTFEVTAKASTLFEKQYNTELKAVQTALAPDLSKYSATAKAAINTVIDAQTTNVERAVTAYKATIKTVKDAKDAIDVFKTAADEVKDALKNNATESTESEKLATAKNAAINALTKAASDFTEAVEVAYKNSVTTSEVAKLNTLTNDVSKMTSLYEDKIAEIVADDTTTNAQKIIALGTVQNTYIPATFSVASSFTAFYADLTILNNADLLYAYADKVAAEKKTEINNDGTLKYDASDVDVILVAARKAVLAAAYDAVVGTGAEPTKTTVDTEINKLSTKTYPLAGYKATAIDTFTTGGYQTTAPTTSAWSDDRYDKVVAIQDKATDEILVATTKDQIDALAKKAKEDIDTVLTKTQITSLEGKATARINALGYNESLDKYFDAIVANANVTAETKAAVIDNAKQLLKDAVVATENKDITFAEIDTILKANYSKAIEELSKVKTKDELKSAAATVDTLITALPNSVTLSDKSAVLAAQKAYDEYIKLPGSAKTDVAYAGKLKNAMVTLMNAETKAVKDMIKALPATVTVSDAAAIEAAEAALKALEATYGNYDNGTDKFGATTDFNYVVTLAPSNAADVDTALTKLETAKIKDAADKIAALGANPTKEAVEAARTAYDALKLVSKLSFNEQLYTDLLNAEKYIATSVEKLKITASSKAYKGKIVVKWTVKGDATGVKYQVYKSTKKSSGYKKAFTTSKKSYTNTKNVKKGVRYYYKVRAYKVIDGKTYYSDWSNKAIRIAK